MNDYHSMIDYDYNIRSNGCNVNSELIDTTDVKKECDSKNDFDEKTTKTRRKLTNYSLSKATIHSPISLTNRHRGIVRSKSGIEPTLRGEQQYCFPSEFDNPTASDMDESSSSSRTLSLSSSSSSPPSPTSTENSNNNGKEKRRGSLSSYSCNDLGRSMLSCSSRRNQSKADFYIKLEQIRKNNNDDKKDPSHGEIRCTERKTGLDLLKNTGLLGKKKCMIDVPKSSNSSIKKTNKNKKSSSQQKQQKSQLSRPSMSRMPSFNSKITRRNSLHTVTVRSVPGLNTRRSNSLLLDRCGMREALLESPHDDDDESDNDSSTAADSSVSQ